MTCIELRLRHVRVGPFKHSTEFKELFHVSIQDRLWGDLNTRNEFDVSRQAGKNEATGQGLHGAKHRTVHPGLSGLSTTEEHVFCPRIVEIHDPCYLTAPIGEDPLHGNGKGYVTFRESIPRGDSVEK